MKTVKLSVIPLICILIVFTASLIILVCITHSINNDYNGLLNEYNNLSDSYEELKENPKIIKEEIPVYIEKPVYYPIEILSEDDFFLLCQLIYREAGSSTTTDLDRTLVGNVALNRLDCNYRGAQTLEEVIYSKGQYSTASVITKDKNIMVPMSSVLAAYRLSSGRRYCPNNVIYQSQGKQGDGVWKKVNHHYYCYSNSIDIDDTTTMYSLNN